VTTTHSRITIAATAIAALAAMSACSSNGASTGASSSGASGSGSSGGAASGKVAFLMPDEASTRYDQHDHPGFVAQMTKDCPKCSVLYNNANGDAAKQQQQFNSALTQGAKVVVLDPVDSSAAASLVQQAHSRGVKVIAYDRPITATQADFYVSFDNQRIGALISKSLVDHLKAVKAPNTGGLLEVNGSPTDAAAGLIKKGIHEGLATGGYKTLAEYDTPEWEPSKAQAWVSGQVSRFHTQIVGVVAANDGTAGGSIAAFKAANVSPVPPVTGNDATTAGLQQIISGDLYNTISKPSEIVAAAAADAAVELMQGKKPTAADTVFNTPSKLFTPMVITKENIKAEIIDKGIAKAADLCTTAYQAACAKLNIS
jgi:D-xylose transport system substrate-binding protein